jgi:predicted Zn-dependent peptidase
MRLRRRGSRPHRIEQTEIGGVPCFWSVAPAPYTATLVFRVGRADETLATSGLTHLSEHLLMPAEPPRDLDRNARVEDLFAVFWATGAEQRALRFLEQTAELIRSPPLERLETERKILLAEAAGRGQHAVTGSAAIRYGAAAHGLSGFDEYGLHKLGADDVAHWVARNFTRGNAALWLTGPPPRELSFELPNGPRRSAPELMPLPEVSYPAVFTNGPPATVVVSIVGERSPSLNVANAVVVDRAWKVIRYEQGLAYDVGDLYEPLTADLAGSAYWIESLEESTEPVREALLGILESVAEEGATQEELDREVELFREMVTDPTQLPAPLHFAAMEHLLGEPFVDTGEWLRRRREVTSESTAEAMRSALERMLLVIPEESRPPEGFEQIPLFSTDRVDGRTYRLSGLPIRAETRKPRLVVGEHGITLVLEDGNLLTVRWAEVVAALRWPDGGRSVLGTDGFRIHVEPEAWRGGKEIVAAIDARTQDDVAIVMEAELTSRVERVEEAAQANLKRRWVVSDELAALPEELDADEQILALAEAARGWRAGLIVLTDRRILWRFNAFGDRRLELSYDEIQMVDVRRKLGETKIELGTADGPYKFSDIAPKERAAEIEQIVRERIATA